MNDEYDQHLRDMNASPLNPLPGGVWLLAGIMLAVEGALLLGGAGLIGGPQAIGWRIAAIERFAFSSAIQAWMFETWRFPLSHLMRYLSYLFVHAGPMHLVFSLIFILAMGKMVGERFGWARFLIAALLPTLPATALFGVVTHDSPNGWLLGAMPMAFALVGAFTWLRVSEAGADRALRIRAFSLIGILLIARLAFGLLGEIGMAWIAEIAAFVFGFGLSALVLAPGRWAHTRRRLRGED